MSDHEDGPNTESTKPRKFILRAPGWRSDLVHLPITAVSKILVTRTFIFFSRNAPALHFVGHCLQRATAYTCFSVSRDGPYIQYTH